TSRSSASFRFRSRNALTLPDHSSNPFELRHAERAALVPRFGTRGRERGLDGQPIGLMDRRGFKIIVYQHEQHGIPFLLELNSAKSPAAGSAYDAAGLDLKASRPRRSVLHSVE